MEHGIGPSAVSHWARDRSVRLATGLTVAVAIPVAVLFYFQFRSLKNLGQSSAVVLRQLSQETADGVTRSVEDALKAPYINVLLRIPQRQTEPLDLGPIANAFEASLGADAFVDRFYVWSDVTDQHRGELLAYDRAHHGFISDVPEAAQVVGLFRDLATQKRAIAALETRIDGRRT